jgi:hypothetical protein
MNYIILKKILKKITENKAKNLKINKFMIISLISFNKIKNISLI